MRIALALLCLAGFLLAQQSEGKQPKESNNSDESSQAAKTPTSPSKPAVTQQQINPNPSTEAERRETNRAPKEPHDWIDKLNAFSTAVVALFTVLLFFGVIYQVRTARRSDRAWVVLADLKDPEYLTFREIPEFVTELETRLQFKNTGHTPAILLNIKSHFKIVKDLDQLPSKPRYASNQHKDIPKYGRILVPDETLNNVVIFMGSKGSTPFREEVQSVIDDKQKMLLYGIVEYMDAFKNYHEFRFCYLWNPKRDMRQMPDGFRLGGPAEYNKTN
jgi:hypothetical protein